MRVMGDLVNEVLSHRYRLVSRIAGGGMGEVYRGHDLLLDRTVAVKILQPSLAADPELVGRFKAEARAAARLSHPNIVAVHDWGAERDSVYYMVMEYVAGTDLRDLLVGRGSLEPFQAASIIASVCDALAVAHARGLVHRDVKPENILIARDGTVKVADFGIAAMTDADRTTNPGGSVTGTLRYLSPEQARGEDASRAADLWAVGAVLCELLTGTPPGSGSGVEILRRRGVEPIAPPSSVDPSIPPQLDAIVMSACALDIDDRYGNAAEMAEDLRRFTSGVEVAPPPVEDLLDNVTGEIRLPDMEPTTFVSNRSRKRLLRQMRKGRMILAIVIGALLIGGGVRAATWLFAPTMVDVPTLTGMTRAEAMDELDDLGLKLQIVERERSADVKQGQIIDQTPVGGQLEEGATVDVVVSAGYPLVAVPGLVGDRLDSVEARLKAGNLEVGDVTYEYSAKQQGTVIAQDPAGGKAEWFTRIDLVVSKGPEPIAVPPVDGKTAEAAVRLLEQAGFVPVTVQEYSNDVEEGRVVRTDPPGGEVAGRGSEIDVIVSMGPEFEELMMPDLRGDNIEAAKSKLDSLGLRYTIIQSCKPGTTVVETDPIAGTTVRENDKVALFVC